MPNLDGRVLGEARELAQSNPNEEVAGLLFSFDELSFYPMENISSDKSFSFELDKRVMLLKDRIYAIFHSHPEGDAYPSDWDKGASMALQVPFLIYSLMYDNFLFFDEGKCNPVQEQG
jgi:proteasome lid subunit RPN8/RPN11